MSERERHPSDKFEPCMIDKALKLYEQGKSITAICYHLGISRETYYQWRADKDHPLNETISKGEKASQAYWEQLGHEGISGEIPKFAGSSWQFVMKNRFRDDYSDTAPQDHTNTLIEKLLDKL